MMRPTFLKKPTRGAFTLVELLVVVAVIAILAAVLFSAIARAVVRAKVARVHSDLRQIGIAIEMYREDCGGLPPVRSCCSGSAKWDYYELPHELHGMRYLAAYRMYDPFNRSRGPDDQLGRTYKYVAINWGYSAGNPAHFTMWIPADYPASNKSCILYYEFAKQIYAYDQGRMYPKAPPIRWAIWSVGPEGDPGLEESGNRMLPVPAREWYPRNQGGIIVRLSDGRKSP